MVTTSHCLRSTESVRSSRYVCLTWPSLSRHTHTHTHFLQSPRLITYQLCICAGLSIRFMHGMFGGRCFHSHYSVCVCVCVCVCVYRAWLTRTVTLSSVQCWMRSMRAKSASRSLLQVRLTHTQAHTHASTHGLIHTHAHTEKYAQASVATSFCELRSIELRRTMLALTLCVCVRVSCCLRCRVLCV